MNPRDSAAGWRQHLPVKQPSQRDESHEDRPSEPPSTMPEQPKPPERPAPIVQAKGAR